MLYTQRIIWSILQCFTLWTISVSVLEEVPQNPDMGVCIYNNPYELEILKTGILNEVLNFCSKICLMLDLSVRKTKQVSLSPCETWAQSKKRQINSWQRKKILSGLDTQANFMYCVQSIHHKDSLVKYQETKYKIKDQNSLICWLAVSTIKPTLDK